MSYIGRFAPSPTGPLHFGSLIAAVASYCDAQSNHGKWLVRMEDLDKPREVTGAADTILQQLEAFGFAWDEPIIYQSQRADLYEATLQSLKQNQLIYPCTCSRKEIVDSATTSGVEGVIYPKTCLSHPPKVNQPAACRVITTEKNLSFTDAIQGNITQNIAKDIGDFILKRADGLFAYQLAVVVDDAAQHITHIVRGADLLASTPRQIYLQQLLNLATPHYAHVPMAVNAAGEKLSKQTLAKPIDTQLAAPLLIGALTFLGQQPPADLAKHALTDIWHWAINNWQLAKVPKTNKCYFASAL
jgi:glutamyl-Q tRNA(Asp) synthetase